MRSLDRQVEDIFFEHRLKSLGIDSAWEYVETRNPSKHLPYHNNQHMFRVAALADRLYDGELDWEIDRRILLMAALFHDFDHSGGKLPDSENIERAVAGFKAYLGYSHCPKFFSEHSYSQERVIRLIQDTEYPPKNDPVSTSARCLRDADLLYSLSDESIPVVMNGLRREFSVARGHEVSLEEMYQGQLKFHAAATFHTELGQQLWTETRELYLRKLQDYFYEHIE